MSGELPERSGPGPPPWSCSALPPGLRRVAARKPRGGGPTSGCQHPMSPAPCTKDTPWPRVAYRYAPTRGLREGYGPQGSPSGVLAQVPRPPRGPRGAPPPCTRRPDVARQALVTLRGTLPPRRTGRLRGPWLHGGLGRSFSTSTWGLQNGTRGARRPVSTPRASPRSPRRAPVHPLEAPGEPPYICAQPPAGPRTSARSPGGPPYICAQPPAGPRTSARSPRTSPGHLRAALGGTPAAGEVPLFATVTKPMASTKSSATAARDVAHGLPPPLGPAHGPRSSRRHPRRSSLDYASALREGVAGPGTCTSTGSAPLDQALPRTRKTSRPRAQDPSSARRVHGQLELPPVPRRAACPAAWFAVSKALLLLAANLQRAHLRRAVPRRTTSSAFI